MLYFDLHFPPQLIGKKRYEVISCANKILERHNSPKLNLNETINLFDILGISTEVLMPDDFHPNKSSDNSDEIIY